MLADPAGAPTPASSALVEMRLLDGANVYFTRPAVKLTLDLRGFSALDRDVVQDVAAQIGFDAIRPGEPGTEQRLRFGARLLARLVRTVASAAGTTRLAVRARPVDANHVVVAYPWRRRGKAEVMAAQVAWLVEQLGSGDLGPALQRAAAAVADADAGDEARVPKPRIPVVAVTGTNGKTTVTRLVAHMGMCAARSVGWSSTDGIYLDGALVEAGDWSGFGGAGRVLDAPGVELAVLETARGGILLRGIGFAHNDVSVVTNVADDHLGLLGVDTLDELADVKAAVVRITRVDGWAVLNAEDPRVLNMSSMTAAKSWVFSLDADSPGVRQALSTGGRATTVLDGDIVVIRPGDDADHLIPVVDVPVTLAGLSRPNLANALAAVSAGLGAGLPRWAVIDALREFVPDQEHNPGRMNVWSLAGRIIVVDFAHNEDGLRALLEVARGLRARDAAVRFVLGAAGDRDDDMLRRMGELAARGADAVVIAQKEKYLRGRTAAEMDVLFRAGAADGGVSDVLSYPTEVAGLEAAYGMSQPGDVVALMCHAQLDDVTGWLEASGAASMGPDAVRTAVLTSER